MLREPKSFFAIVLGLFISASILFASEETELSPDAVLLDKLVEKNLISEAEARECKKNIAEQPVITSPNLNKIRFGGYSQWRYYSMWQDYNSPSASGKISENDFSMPRLVIKVFADLQDDITSIMALNLAAPEVFDTYFIRKHCSICKRNSSLLSVLCRIQDADFCCACIYDFGRH